MEHSYKRIDNYYFKISGKPLGEGAFGTVYRACDKTQEGKEAAVKVIPVTKILESEDNFLLFMREIEVLSQLRGEHVIRFLDVIRTTNNLYIFTEFCDGGDLEHYLEKNGPMGEEKALELVYQISKTFNTINNPGLVEAPDRRLVIMHRDIKPANILFHDEKVKISDFGFAKMVSEPTKNVKGSHYLLGTPLYMAPQILNDEPYTVKCDIWSSGIVLYECIFGHTPWTGESEDDLYKNIREDPIRYPRAITPETKDLLEKMLQRDEAIRISWEEIEGHPSMMTAKKKYENRSCLLRTSRP